MADVAQNTRAIPIFVSSTFEDLRDHRTAVEHSLHRIEAVVRGMEFFGSRPGRPREECLAEVRKCRVYIGIFGTRYGSIDPQSQLSLTHLEYLEAQRIGIPTLIYLLDEERHPVLPRFVDRGELGAKLDSLRGELKRRHVVSFFESPADLARQVTQDLPGILQSLGVGVQSNILLQIVGDLPRIGWLTDERWTFLRGKLGDLAERGIPDPVLRGSAEYLLTGDRLSAAYLTAKGANFDLRQAIDHVVEIEKVIGAIVDNGRKRIATTDPRD